MGLRGRMNTLSAPTDRRTSKEKPLAAGSRKRLHHLERSVILFHELTDADSIHGSLATMAIIEENEGTVRSFLPFGQGVKPAQQFFVREQIIVTLLVGLIPGFRSPRVQTEVNSPAALHESRRIKSRNGRHVNGDQVQAMCTEPIRNLRPIPRVMAEFDRQWMARESVRERFELGHILRIAMKSLRILAQQHQQSVRLFQHGRGIAKGTGAREIVLMAQ